MKLNKPGSKIVLAIALICPMGAIASPKLAFRPQVNVGYLNSFSHHDVNGLAYSFGGRFIVSASETQSFGIDVNHWSVQNLSDDRFTSAGIVLEQKLGGWFSMSIGTVIYFNYGADDRNVGGVTTNLGWEPNFGTRLVPFITYKTDFIFAEEFTMINALNAGCTIKF